MNRINRKKAFTLAEVLITLAIIGVVAAMTIPTVLSNYQKKETVTRLKKTYSELAQAISASQLENENYQSWDYSLNAYDFFNKYLTPFIKISETTVSDARLEGYKWLQISGNEETGLWNLRVSGEHRIITLSSGVQIFLPTIYTSGQTSNATSKSTGFLVDLNGFNKPNQLGKDLFYFTLHINKGLLLAYKNDDESYDDIPMRTREELMDKSQSPTYSYQCNKQGRGLWCGALIMVDNWEIRSDYPW
ncbi:MAG: type II secretion system GspH family protein [Candidatus Gastranaerophilales bacterium]|nr:type II secretion system GspH family protein [Candidatus Gastranaerophilales bacterium]